VIVAEDAPARIVIDPGTVAEVLDDVKVTIAPPVPAGPESVTVPVDVLPPVTVEGLSVILCSVAGVIVRVVVTGVPVRVAEMVAEVLAFTDKVVMLKFAEVFPAGTVTVDGGVAFALLDANFTTIPAVGAAPLSVTVPVEGVPPVTEVGETATLTKAGGVTVRVPVFETVPNVPVRVAFAVVETGVVETVKLAELAPAATVTEDGSVAFALFEARVTTAPDGPAFPVPLTESPRLQL